MKKIITYFKILKLFFKKYFPQVLKECRDEIMFKIGWGMTMTAAVMLFYFCILGFLLNPIAYYAYVAIMATLMATGVLLKASSDYTRSTENEQPEENQM